MLTNLYDIGYKVCDLIEPKIAAIPDVEVTLCRPKVEDGMLLISVDIRWTSRAYLRAKGNDRIAMERQMRSRIIDMIESVDRTFSRGAYEYYLELCINNY